MHLAVAQIPKPTDAPKPLGPAEAAKAIETLPGFRLELAAGEPLITEPSGVCWDEQGRRLVCELHGYNLEGQVEAIGRRQVVGQRVGPIHAASPELSQAFQRAE